MRRLSFILCLAVTVSGCAKEDPSAHAPSIRYGQDLCAECRMIVSEVKFSAALHSDGTWKKFDDIGCMDVYRKKHGMSGVAWVHDYPSGEWIREERSSRVVLKELRTPMGYGVAAFSDAEDAEKFEHSLKGGKT